MTGPAAEVADRLLLTVPVGAAPDAPVVLARAQWPAAEDDALTPVAGFVLSSFSPLVAEVAERCLQARYGGPAGAAAAPNANRTALVLASSRGDVTTAEAAAAAAAAGRRVPPLLFYQSNPNAVLGHVAARWGLAGPVVSTAPLGDPLADGLTQARLLVDDGEAAEVLVVAAEVGTPGAEPDRAVAVLVGRPAEMSVVVPAALPELPEPPAAVPGELALPGAGGTAGAAVPGDAEPREAQR